ncbi:pyocin knob domain-containing protein, partial [Rodentibacter caecimuris]
MALHNKPDEYIFASEAKQGEVDNFPDLPRGWGISFEQTGGIPPMEWFNYLFKRIDEKYGYLMQRGLSEWSATQDYPKGAFVQHKNLSYKALTANKSKEPGAVNAADWQRWGFTLTEIAKATLQQAGIVQLNSATNSTSETQAATPKAVKTVKDQLDSVQRNQANYIPNSKKSNAVNSASSDTVATSVAVKTAYDKGVEAKNAADNANNNVNRRAFGLALSNEDLNSIAVTGIYGQSLNSNSTSARHYPIEQAGKLIVTGSSGFGAQQLYISYHDNHIYARGKNQNGWSDWKRIDGLNGVSKSGDTMTGNLVIDTDDSLLKGKRSGVNKYAVGLRNSTSND